MSKFELGIAHKLYWFLREKNYCHSMAILWAKAWTKAMRKVKYEAIV
jgi:hypothetical protein